LGDNLLKKSIAGGIIFLFLLSSIIPLVSSYSSYETNKVYTIHIDENGTLSGYVKDTSMNPIEGARVKVYFHETYEENYSDSSGYYHVTNIPICYCLKNATVSKEGYRSECVLLAINETTKHDFILKRFLKRIYVGGSGPGNYSKIQDAIDDAGDGDTVFVYNGTYYENIEVDKTISLIGEDRYTTIIDGGKTGSVVNISKNNVTITNFTIKVSGNTIDDGGIRINSDNNLISGNILNGNSVGVKFYGSYYNNIIVNNKFKNNYCGIVGACPGNVFMNNNFSNNNVGIMMWSPLRIENNTFMENNIGLEIYSSTGGSIISNNFIKNEVPIWMKWAQLYSILKNNFINNEEDPYFHYNLGMTCRQYWNENYWSGLPDDSKYKVISGVLIIFSGGIFYPGFSIGIHWPNFDWHPAKEP
jgi:parallel beta-helix repeat protein